MALFVAPGFGGAYDYVAVAATPTATGFRLTGLPSSVDGTLGFAGCFDEVRGVTVVAGQTRSQDVLVTPFDQDGSEPGVQQPSDSAGLPSRAAP